MLRNDTCIEKNNRRIETGRRRRSLETLVKQGFAHYPQSYPQRGFGAFCAEKLGKYRKSGKDVCNHENMRAGKVVF